MTSNVCGNVNGTWDLFHISALVFYGAYGILCWFFPEIYGKNIYFRGNWKELHSTDTILWYFMIGAGECCVHMSLLTLFIFKFGVPDRNIDLSDWMEAYLIIQILTWIKWTITEAYYTYKKVEWFVIGCVHVTLCLIVLSMAIANYTNVKTNCL
jgi:hypothetical protein